MPEYRYSERSCSRFLPAINELRTFPERLRIIPVAELSAETLMCRFRDSIKAYALNLVPTYEDHELSTDCQLIRKLYTISIVTNEVWAYKKGGKKELEKVGAERSVTDAFSLECETDNLNSIKAIFQLVSERLLANARVKTPLNISEISDLYDAAVVTNPDGSYTIC